MGATISLSSTAATGDTIEATSLAKWQARTAVSFFATLFTNLVNVFGDRCVATNSAATQVTIRSICRLRPSNGIKILMRGQPSGSLAKSSNVARTFPASANGVLQPGVEVARCWIQASPVVVWTS